MHDTLNNFQKDVRILQRSHRVFRKIKSLDLERLRVFRKIMRVFREIKSLDLERLRVFRKITSF